MRKIIGMTAALLVCASCAPPAAAAAAAAGQGQPQRDGAHDFDWDIGTWKTRQRRLLHPLTGSTTWVQYSGTDVVRALWDGANQGLIEADGPAGHLEIFTLRLYSPDARQWSIAFATRAAGSLSPPVVGEFAGGRGDFYSQEPYGGRTILVRFSVSDITPDSCHFEQAFSSDGGKTWEPNFVVEETRVHDGSSGSARRMLGPRPCASRQGQPSCLPHRSRASLGWAAWYDAGMRTTRTSAGSRASA